MGVLDHITGRDRATVPYGQANLAVRTTRDLVKAVSTPDQGDASIYNAKDPASVIRNVRIVESGTDARDGSKRHRLDFLNGTTAAEVIDALQSLSSELIQGKTVPLVKRTLIGFNAEAEILDKKLFEHVISLASMPNTHGQIREAAMETVDNVFTACRNHSMILPSSKQRLDLYRRIVQNKDEADKLRATSTLLREINDKFFTLEGTFEGKITNEIEWIRKQGGAAGEAIANIVEYELRSAIQNPETILSTRTASGRRFMGDPSLQPAALEFQQTLAKIWRSRRNASIENPYANAIEKMLKHMPGTEPHEAAIEEFSSLVRSFTRQQDTDAKSLKRHQVAVTEFNNTLGQTREIDIRYASDSQITSRYAEVFLNNPIRIDALRTETKLYEIRQYVDYLETHPHAEKCMVTFRSEADGNNYTLDVTSLKANLQTASANEINEIYSQISRHSYDHSDSAAMVSRLNDHAISINIPVDLNNFNEADLKSVHDRTFSTDSITIAKIDRDRKEAEISFAISYFKEHSSITEPRIRLHASTAKENLTSVTDVKALSNEDLNHVYGVISQYSTHKRDHTFMVERLNQFGPKPIPVLRNIPEIEDPRFITTKITKGHISTAARLKNEVEERINQRTEEFDKSYMQDIKYAMEEVPGFGRYIIDRLSRAIGNKDRNDHHDAEKLKKVGNLVFTEAVWQEKKDRAEAEWTAGANRLRVALQESELKLIRLNNARTTQSQNLMQLCSPNTMGFDNAEKREAWLSVLAQLHRQTGNSAAVTLSRYINHNYVEQDPAAIRQDVHSPEDLAMALAEVIKVEHEMNGGGKTSLSKMRELISTHETLRSDANVQTLLRQPADRIAAVAKEGLEVRTLDSQILQVQAELESNRSELQLRERNRVVDRNRFIEEFMIEEGAKEAKAMTLTLLKMSEVESDSRISADVAGTLQDIFATQASAAKGYPSNSVSNTIMSIFNELMHLVTAFLTGERSGSNSVASK